MTFSRNDRFAPLFRGAVLAFLGSTGAVAQSSDAEAAALLLEGGFEEQERAIVWAQSRAPAEISPVLRDALVTALDRAMAEYHAGLRAWARGENPPQHSEDADLKPALLEIIVSLRDPRTIPVLARSVSTGWMAIGALLWFGEDAVPALSDVARSLESSRSQVRSALYALRMIIEKEGVEDASEEMLAEARRAASDRLSGRQGAVVLRQAIDLAATLGDPELEPILRSLASDREAVVERGVEDADRIRAIQKQAADRLAGIPPRPNPRRGSTGAEAQEDRSQEAIARQLLSGIQRSSSTRPCGRNP